MSASFSYAWSFAFPLGPYPGLRSVNAFFSSQQVTLLLVFFCQVTPTLHWYLGGERHCERKALSCPRTQLNDPGQGTNLDRSINVFEHDCLFCTGILHMIHPVAIMKMGGLVANRQYFFLQDVIYRYVSEDNMNISLSLFIVGDLPNGFSFLF